MCRLLVTFMFLIAGANVASAQDADTRPPLKCAVTQVAPNDPDFFTTAFGVPRAPQVDDRITLDLGGDVVEDLLFESGRGIPLARFGAKLKRVTPQPAQFFDVFFVQQQGVLAYYEGVLAAQYVENSATVTIKAVKRRHSEPAVPFVLEMTCTP